MFIKRLRILDTAGDCDVIMREVSFHLGANFVVDAESSEAHNKVGKTTFLKLIDILMGAKDRKLLYTDSETNTVSTTLRNIISKRQVAAELILTDSLRIESSTDTVLRVELFPHGAYYIDGVKVNQDAYRKSLNTLLFQIEDNTPTFRQLIPYFVRVSVQGDSNRFLKMLPDKTSIATYRSIYNFLFDISDPQLDKKLSDLNLQQSKVRESLRQYQRINNVSDLEKQEQILSALESEYQDLKVRIDDLIDSNQYKRNRAVYSEIRARYSTLVDERDDIEYRINLSLESIDEAKRELDRHVDLDLSRRFYEEIASDYPNLEKSFEDMTRFNQKLAENKRDYFEEIYADLLQQRDEINKQLNKLIQENGQYLSLIADDKIDEYGRLSEELNQLKQEMGRNQEIVESLKGYEADLAAIKVEIERYSTGGAARTDSGDIFRNRMDSFNRHFTKLADRINGEKPILVYSSDTKSFPVSIVTMEGTSTGTRKSLLAAYDLAYQLFATERNKSVPHFIVHDVVENIEGDNLRTIADIANGMDCQYIVAVLKEKLDSSDISQADQDKMSILHLSTDDMLFEGITVNSVR